MAALPALFVLLSTALAAPPKRQVPPSVLAEVQRVEQRFELALATDCDAGRCFSGGCVYVDHQVADRPRSRSLPGLTEEGGGPGSVDPQAFLTRASCSFTHEEALEAEDIQALVRRLQARTSTGWAVVSVSATALQPLPSYLRETPEEVAQREADEAAARAAEAAAPAPPPPETDTWTFASAMRELWTALLPHAFWMVGLGLVTAAATTLIWAARRVGTVSVEEQALLAELTGGAAGGADPVLAETAVSEDVPSQDEWVAEQRAAWQARLAHDPTDPPDPELQALLRQLLRGGETALLAKAVLTFPDALPAAFPKGGDVATAKLALAQTLKTVREEDLPDDATFFAALNRHALSATLAAQSDAEIVRSLREDFGAAGLAALLQQRAPRVGALLFALAPAATQQEAVRLLSDATLVDLAGQLLRSNRMDERETEHLFAVLRGARGDGPMPARLEGDQVSDQGAPFDAAAALSVLLPRVDPSARTALFQWARQRFAGSFPTWYQGILTPSMLGALDSEARADLLLSIDTGPLNAWVAQLESNHREAILAGAPNALRAAVQAGAPAGDPVALAEQGRRALAAGFQTQLARTGRTLVDVLAPGAA